MIGYTSTELAKLLNVDTKTIKELLNDGPFTVSHDLVEVYNEQLEEHRSKCKFAFESCGLDWTDREKYIQWLEEAYFESIKEFNNKDR